MPHSRLIGLLATAALVAACTGAAPATPTTAPTGSPTGAPTATPQAWPDRLVIGFVPSREAAALVETIQPIADHLTQALGIPVDGYVSTDYPALVVAMQTGQAQIGAFGPFAMLQAVTRAGAEIILQSERNGSATYHTQFMTNNPDRYCTISPPVENERESQINPGTFLNCNGTERGPTDTPQGPIGTEAIANIPPGTTISFVNETSTSGYIFPATVLIVNGIALDSITAYYAGQHDASAVAVCQGTSGVEVGVSFDDARSEVAAPPPDCSLNEDVVVFAYGPEIPNDGVVVDGDLPDDLKLAIKQALIDYSETEEGREVLQRVYNITAFAEPNLDALQIVRDAARELGIE
ncbi:MAG: phosphate/phosphite/phosphonate ABC transporter substrate-binding protein [Chloroflexota bacterium]|nr:phosphate/phosphite/phosphonate ABC transporter substrate-binding protein [Chloroflexota bacterium]